MFLIHSRENRNIHNQIKSLVYSGPLICWYQLYEALMLLSKPYEGYVSWIKIFYSHIPNQWNVWVLDVWVYYVDFPFEIAKAVKKFSIWSWQNNMVEYLNCFMVYPCLSTLTSALTYAHSQLYELNYYRFIHVFPKQNETTKKLF